jgi:hypothetical protein
MNKYVNLSFLWTDINRSTAETKEISIKVLEQLERQEQSILNTNKNLNESKDLLDTSDKILNNMSWFGWFKSFIPFKSLLSRIFRRRSHTEEKLFIDNESFNKNEQSDFTLDERNSFIPIKYEYQLQDKIEINDKNNVEILNLEKELTDLLWIGSKIGEHLDLHNDYLDKMKDKSQIIFDKTKKTTKKTNNFL